MKLTELIFKIFPNLDIIKCDILTLQMIEFRKNVIIRT